MANIYLNIKDDPKEDCDFHLVGHIDNDDRIRDADIVGIRICPMWSQLHSAQQRKKEVNKENRFLYKKNKKVE